jgi:hypothetical protein
MNNTNCGPTGTTAPDRLAPKPALEGPIAAAYARVRTKYANALKALADTAEPESNRGS